MFSATSADYGASWTASSLIAAGGRNAAPVLDRGEVSVFYNTTSSIMFARISTTRDSGTVISTVSNAVPLQARPAQYRATVYPTGGVGADGTLYVAWADGRNAGRGNDILLSRSTDGTNWNAPAVVNSDASSADQLVPSLAVGKDNVVTVAWLDNRNDPKNVNYDIYMARSFQAQDFSANQRVTSVSSNPYNDARTHGSMIGDYFSIALGDGVVYPVWTDTRNNNEDIYVAPMSFKAGQ